MKVCFDLRAAQKNSRFTGVGVYTYEVGLRLLLKYPNMFFLVRKNCELPFAIPESNLIKIKSFNKPESLQELTDPFVAKRKLIRNHIDVFHSPIPSYLTSNSNFKVVISVHDVIPDIYPDERHKPFLNQFLYRKKNKNASMSDFIIFDSYSTQNDFVKLYGEPNECSVVYLGSEQSAQSEPISSFDFDFYGKYIFYIGGFNKRKNFDYIFKILPKIMQENKLNFVIGGNISKNNVNRVKNLCKLNNIDFSKVHFTGRLNVSDLSRFYKFSCFFLYPSMYEGFGLPIAEALNEKCLIFSTNNSSIPEVGGKSIVYITGTDPENDIRIINNTLQNTSLIKELKINGKHQRDLFSWDKTTKKIIGIYKKIHENTYRL